MFGGGGGFPFACILVVCLWDCFRLVAWHEGEPDRAYTVWFPFRSWDFGCVVCGQASAGGHNKIAGDQQNISGITKNETYFWASAFCGVHALSVNKGETPRAGYGTPAGSSRMLTRTSAPAPVRTAVRTQCHRKKDATAARSSRRKKKPNQIEVKIHLQTSLVLFCCSPRCKHMLRMLPSFDIALQSTARA